MDDILQDFLAETAERLATADQDIVLLEQDGQNRAALTRIFRAVHNIKSSAGFLHLSRLQSLSHAMEAVLVAGREDRLAITPLLATLLLAGFDRLRGILAALGSTGAEPAGNDDALIEAFDCAARLETFAVPQETDDPAATQSHSMRVDVAVLENLMALTGEMVLIRNRLQQTGDLFDAAGQSVSLQKLHFLVSALQAEVLKSRMQPVMQAFRALPRLLRDAAAVSGKRVGLTMTGGHTAMDRQVLDAIRDPLAQLLRNAVAHGIEQPADREKAGKPAQGAVHLSAGYADGCVVVKITDDGRGLDAEKIAAQAVAQGLLASAAARNMQPEGLWPFIFVSGFSTHDGADHLAGRGIGLDIVRAAVEKIGGSVQVESQAGRGTVFTMRLPMTLAIAPSVIVRAGGQRYALPKTAVSEMVLLDNRVAQIGGSKVLRLRDQIVPLLSLRHIFQLPAEEKTPDSKAVLLRGHKGLLAVAVEDIEYAEDVVVKPLPDIFGATGYFLGSAVLANGGLVLIADPNRLMEKHMPHGAAAAPLPAEDEAAIAAHEKISCVIFRPADQNVLQALPMSDVLRLADVTADETIAGSNGDLLLKTRDGGYLPVRGNGQAALRQAIVVQASGRTYALAAEKIIDIAQIAAAALQAGDTAAGIRHRFAWQNGMVELRDAAFYAPREKAAEQHTAGARRRVLLIDDSPFFCRLMRPMLQTAGYEVVAVQSAAEAIDLCRQAQAFDAVISDIEMPDMNGLQLAQQLRGLQTARNIPLLAMSSYASARDAARARAAGFDHFLNKFDSAGLMAALSKVQRGGV